MSDLDDAAASFRAKWGFDPRPFIEDALRRGEFDIEGGTEEERQFLRELLMEP